MAPCRSPFRGRAIATRMLASLLFTTAVTHAAHAQIAFTGLGGFQGLPGSGASRAYAMSSDGTVITGVAVVANGATSGFRWTAADGLTPVNGGLPQATTSYSISGDGHTIGGYVESIIDAKAYVWTPEVGPTLLFARGTLWAASADGAVFAGDEMDGGTHQHHAVRWTATNGVKSIEPHGVVLGMSRAFGIDATGGLLVGEAVFPQFGNQRAFLWDATHGMVNIGSPDVAAGPSRADAISADGGTVVGTTQPGTFGATYAFRWTAATGTQWLDFGATSSEAFAVSADGSTLVGTRGGEAFLWRASDGLVRLADVLGGLAAGWRLVEARAISADGRVIAGWGYNPQNQIEAFRAEVPLAVAGVDPPSGPHVALVLGAAPNPARGLVQVRATHGDAGAASEASVLDLSGRLVCSLGSAAAVSGARAWTWDGRDALGRAVAPGAYLVRVRVGDETRVQRIMQVR